MVGISHGGFYLLHTQVVVRGGGGHLATGCHSPNHSQPLRLKDANGKMKICSVRIRQISVTVVGDFDILMTSNGILNLTEFNTVDSVTKNLERYLVAAPVDHKQKVNVGSFTGELHMSPSL